MHIDLLLTLLGTAACASALDLEKYRFRWTPEYTRADNVAEVAGNLRLRAEGEDYVEAATRLVKGIVPEGIEFRLVDDHYVGDNGVGHVYFKQTVHGVDVDNAIFNVNVSQDGCRW
jgi:extracellular elastinolytic metalloproteinase